MFRDLLKKTIAIGEEVSEDNASVIAAGGGSPQARWARQCGPDGDCPVCNPEEDEEEDIDENADKKIQPAELHQWYLDGSKELDPDNFNEEAQVPYEELPEPQRKMDQFIADKINAKLFGNKCITN